MLFLACRAINQTEKISPDETKGKEEVGIAPSPREFGTNHKYLYVQIRIIR